MDSGFRLAEEHGAEFVTGVRDLSHVLSLDSDFKDRNVEDRRSLLSYAIEGGLAFHYLSNKEIARLHDESVPIDFAIERVKEQGVDRLVEIHKSGINKAVSSGWL
jgi:hypothetical protein